VIYEHAKETIASEKASAAKDLRNLKGELQRTQVESTRAKEELSRVKRQLTESLEAVHSSNRTALEAAMRTQTAAALEAEAHQNLARAEMVIREAEHQVADATNKAAAAEASASNPVFEANLLAAIREGEYAQLRDEIVDPLIADLKSGGPSYERRVGSLVDMLPTPKYAAQRLDPAIRVDARYRPAAVGRANAGSNPKCLCRPNNLQ